MISTARNDLPAIPEPLVTQVKGLGDQCCENKDAVR